MDSVKAGDNKYCGPAVLSIITGKSTDECASVLGAIQGRNDVREVSVEDMRKACKKLRFTMELVPLTENSSLFYAFHSLYNQPGLYMVFVKKHVIAVEVNDSKEIFICDNHSKEPIDARNSSRLGQKCLGIYKLTVKQSAQFISEEIKITQSTYGIGFNKLRTYVDAEDNVELNLGYLTITDDKDIINLIYELNSFVGVKHGIK